MDGTFVRIGCICWDRVLYINYDRYIIMIQLKIAIISLLGGILIVVLVGSFVLWFLKKIGLL